MDSVRNVMESRNVAVIGASKDSRKPGGMLLKALVETGFKGKLAGVNPRGGEIHGVTLYQNIGEVPFAVDLAVLFIPPKAVPQAVRECAQKGVKGVVISSEGFAESGREGMRYQEEVGSILRTSGMRGFGPNTMGIVNTATGLTTGSFTTKEMLEPGSIGLVSQTGTFVGAMLRYLSSFEILHVSKVLGLGNKVDVDESDALTYLSDDDQTRIVGMYLEDIRDGRRFLDVARETTRRKPVLLVKGGRTSAGATASATHTASLAMDDAVLNGALRQAGVLRMKGIDELINTLIGFQCLPLPKGDHLALVTFSGALAIMSIDVAIEEGLGLARLSDRTGERLSRVISTPSKTRNPIDIYPDMVNHGFEKTSTEILRALLDDSGVHGIIFICFAISGIETYRPLVEIIRENRTKPVFFSLLGDKEHIEICREYMEQNQIPLFLFPDTAVRVFSNMRRYARTLEGKRGGRQIRKQRSS
ncbi:MAG: CoA-binding protein [Pseudomonadota bacterium]